MPYSCPGVFALAEVTAWLAPLSPTGLYSNVTFSSRSSWPPYLKSHQTLPPPHSQKHSCSPYPAIFSSTAFISSSKDSLFPCSFFFFPQWNGGSERAGTLSVLLCALNSAWHKADVPATRANEWAREPALHQAHPRICLIW